MPTRSFITLLAVLAAVALPASAGAATTDDCRVQISALRGDTAGVTTFLNGKDQTSLLGKLDNTTSALTAGKTDDAIRKLTDFRTKVETLGATGKLGVEDAARLAAEATAASSCLESSIGAGSLSV